MGFEPTPVELRRLMQIMDKNSDQRIDLDEFREFIGRLPKNGKLIDGIIDMAMDEQMATVTSQMLADIGRQISASSGASKSKKGKSSSKDGKSSMTPDEAATKIQVVARGGSDRSSL